MDFATLVVSIFQQTVSPMFFLWIACADDITYYQDVQPILESRCINCHAADAIGNVDFTDIEVVQEWGPVIEHVVGNRSMPPWSAEGDFMNDWSLSDEQISTIQDWVENGMPLGNPNKSGSSLPLVGTRLSRVDKTLAMPLAYTTSVDSGDEYRCFVLDWDGENREYITGFNALPGNPQIVHHVAAFLVRPDGLMGEGIFEAITEWENVDEEAGYSCFGGPTLSGSSSQIPIEQIAQWVPGNQGLDFPTGTGIPIDAGSKIILQLHYNLSPTVSEKTDLTTLQFSLSESVDSLAAYAPWLSGLWPVSGMSIPAGATGVVHSVDADPRGFFELLNPSLELNDGFVIHGMMLHMHRLGRSGRLTLNKADGSSQELIYIPKWDFDWQFTYLLNEPVLFENGDTLALECVFDNNAENAVDVDWGEGTQDEMCVGNLYISILSE